MTESATETTFVEEWFNGPGNIRFYTRLFPAVNQPRAIVLFVHGNLEHGWPPNTFHHRLT
jgi:alpha-beta hydrolase superfamily lysophospholipase